VSFEAIRPFTFFAMVLQLQVLACKTPASDLTMQSSLAAAGAPSLGPSDPGYEDITGCQKQDILWQKMVNSKYATLPQWSGREVLKVMTDSVAMKLFHGSTKSYYQVSMQRQSDEMPPGRKKVIHTYGQVAKVKFVPAPGSPYSGLFRGVSCGLIRAGTAAKAPSFADNDSVPGVAVKFLINGQPSRNFMALFTLDGQTGGDFFKNNFTNWTPPVKVPAVIRLGTVFSLVSSNFNRVDVKYLGDVQEDGTHPASPQAPLQIVLIPNRSDLTKYYVPNDTAHDTREDFKNIPSGTTLYQVVAVMKPWQPAEAPGDATVMGDIVTTSEFIASDYGDKSLFFRHQLFTGDTDPP